jgi:hypothetical protein
MAIIKSQNTKTSRTVTLPTMTSKEFEDGFLALKNGGDENKVDNYMRNMTLKTFNGETFENDGRGSNQASFAVNFAKMCDSVGPEYKAPGTDRSYAGSCENGMPIDIVAYTDVSDNNPDTRDKYVVTADLRAIASANYIERKAAAERDGRTAPDPKSADRIAIKYTFPTTENGVAGMSLDGLTKNVGKAATQRYILTASQKTAGDVPTADAVKSVAEVTKNTFESVMKDCIDGKANKDMKTTGYNGKGTIEGTKVDKPNFDIKSMKVGEATVYAIDTSKSDVKVQDVNKWLVDVNNRFNKTLSQDVNSKFAAKSEEAKLGNMVGIQAYAVVPQDPATGEKKDMILIQPAMTAQLQPFTSSLIKAYDAATHSKDYPAKEGEAKNVSVEDIYGKEIVENAGKLAATYNAPSGRTKDEAIAAVQAQLEGIQAGLER